MDIDYEKAIALQGSWGYTPTTPLLDLQAENFAQSQPSLYRLVETTFQDNLSSGGKDE
jgi:hypothetical protein